MHTLQQLRSGELKGIKRLTLSCNLAEFPQEVFSLAESLEVLDLSNNRLSALPDDFGRLSNLRIAFFSDNQFTTLPEVLRDCPKLDMIGFKSNKIAQVPEQALPEVTRWLILTNNRITKLPRSIGNCTRLQKVGLAGNLLTALPDEMADCRNLELLRISANRFAELPEWLLRLPKLSWLAFAGNPFSHRPAANDSLPMLNWAAFELMEQLGEGASGHIYKAHWKDQGREVAIKVFKGEVTSDGFPEDELAASVAAGSHNNLVKLLGRITGHPQQKNGLVMALIPSAYYNLGLPPSLASCSRDVFADGTQFKAIEIYKIAAGIASAALQLHEKGIMHGDLYAHNILIDEAANSLMGDFGAGSFYDKNSVHALPLQRIESRAFGCLLDDLLMHLDSSERKEPMAFELQQLRDACMKEVPGERPLFEEIVKRLARIRS